MSNASSASNSVALLASDQRCGQYPSSTTSFIHEKASLPGLSPSQRAETKDLVMADEASAMALAIKLRNKKDIANKSAFVMSAVANALKSR